MICYSFKLSCLHSASSLVPLLGVFPLISYLFTYLFFIIITSYPIFDVKVFEIHVFFFFFFPDNHMVCGVGG